MESLLEIYNKLNSLGYILEPFHNEDEYQLYDIFRHVVDSGCQFPYESNSMEEFHYRFFSSESRVYVCHFSDEVVGGFYIRPNFPGRSSHIANAAYMIKDNYRSLGLGTLLIEASLYIAKNLGFQAMQFNEVFTQNIAAIKVYQKLGFNIIGTIPEAVRNPDGSYQAAHVMYRKLED